MKKRPYILTIAGFDPSGGAGILADIKTFESLKCYGIAVCTANTIQTDTSFLTCNWIDKATLIAQLELMLSSYKLSTIKIGIIQSWELLNEVLNLIQVKQPLAKVIFDPVITSSSAFDFHDTAIFNESLFDEVLRKVHLITPNIAEINQLYPKLSQQETVKHMARITNVYLKGGHNETKKGIDQLILTNGKQYHLNPKLKNCTEKHGSGCVLSAGIASYLALGFPLLKACFRAKRYTENVLSSNNTLLGYHG